MEAGWLETTRMLLILKTVFNRFVELAPMCVAARTVADVVPDDAKLAS